MFSCTFYCIFQILFYYWIKESTTASEKRKKNGKKKKRQKKNPVTRFLVTPFTRYAVTHFTGGYTHNMLLNMQILKDGAIADGGLYVLIYWQFLLQRRLSDSIEQYNEPPRYRSYRNFAKSIFVVQIYQTDAQHGGSRITNLAERYWRNDWRETLLDRQDIISELRWTYLCCIML